MAKKPWTTLGPEMLTELWPSALLDRKGEVVWSGREGWNKSSRVKNLVHLLRIMSLQYEKGSSVNLRGRSLPYVRN